MQDDIGYSGTNGFEEAAGEGVASCFAEVDVEDLVVAPEYESTIAGVRQWLEDCGSKEDLEAHNLAVTERWSKDIELDGWTSPDRDVMGSLESGNGPLSALEDGFRYSNDGFAPSSHGLLAADSSPMSKPSSTR